MGVAVAVFALLWFIFNTGGGSIRRLSGTYVGTSPVQVKPGTDPFIAKQLSTIKLIIKTDQLAYLSVAGIPVTGHIEYASKQATFVPDAVADTPIARVAPEMKRLYTVTLTPVGETDWLYNGTIRLRPTK